MMCEESRVYNRLMVTNKEGVLLVVTKQRRARRHPLSVRFSLLSNQLLCVWVWA